MENEKIDSIGLGIKIVSIIYIIMNILGIVILVLGLIMESSTIDIIRSDVLLTSVEYEKILYTGIALALIHIICIIMILRRMKIGVIVFYAIEILSILYNLIVQGEKFSIIPLIFPVALGMFIYRKRDLYEIWLKK